MLEAGQSRGRDRRAVSDAPEATAAPTSPAADVIVPTDSTAATEPRTPADSAEPAALTDVAAGTAQTAATNGHKQIHPRLKAWWLAWLAWSAGIIAAGIGLCVCYLHVSRTQPVSSDGASNALQAWDMLHGNPLLRGWLLGHVSFYTTELPEYVIVEAIRGLHADVLHVSAAITYTLLVLVAGLLARGGVKGREGVTRALIAAGIMIAPQLGPGAFILVFQPDHVGTQVPLLATWLVLDRAPRRWFVPVVVGVMLAWTEVADSFVVLIGAVPLAAVAGVRAYQVLVQRRGPLRSGWFDLSLVAAAALSVEAAKIAVKLIGDHGGYSVLPVPTGLATSGAMPTHVWLMAEGVLGLYGAVFFGLPSVGLTAGIAFLHLAGVALAAWALCLVIRRFFKCDDLVAQVLAASIVITMAAYLFSTIPITYYSARYLAGVLAGGAVLAGRMLASTMIRARLVPAAAVVLACYLAALGYTVAQPSRPAVSQDLADWLVANHLTYGLSSYGIGNATTLASGGAVSIRSVSFYNNDAAPGPYEFDQTWYDPLIHDANFVVLMNPPVPLDQIATGEALDAFGRPTRVYDFGPYVIMTYDTNLLTDLSPSLPPGS